MTTLVGKQESFDDAMIALLELEYDALEAYEVAVNKLENPLEKQKMREFMQDHQQHISELTHLLKANHVSKVPDGPTGKQWLTKGKVVLGSLFGDNAILLAMETNELDTNMAYERMVKRTDQWPGVQSFLNQAFIDERKHKAWIEEQRK